MKPWHIRIAGYGHAFIAPPTNIFLAIYFFYRGWRPALYGYWWTISSKNQTLLEKQQ